MTSTTSKTTAPAVKSLSKVFILTGPFGGGKTMTALSYVPPTWTGVDSPVKRIVIDPEMRARVHQSPDEKDYPDQELFAYRDLSDGRFSPARFISLMETTHKKTWKEGPPDAIIIDDAGIFQDVMFAHWANKEVAVATAKIYGLEGIQQLNQKSWRPTDPGVLVLVFKRFFEEFILDLREQNISLLITAPLHNIWKDFGAKSYDADGKPSMRVLGKSAKILDVFIKHADIVWLLERVDATSRKLKQIPTAHMDPWNPKASMPGLPEQFEWCGWPTLWTWHRERKFHADLSKLTMPEPEFDQESLEAMTRAKKVQLYKDLEGIATVEEINAIMADPDAPTYTIETHSNIVEYVKRVVSEKK